MSSGRTASLQWDQLDLADPARAQEAADVSRTICSTFGFGARAFDLQWRLGPAADSASLRIYILRRDAVVAGFAVFSRRRRPLKFLLGEVTVAQLELTRYWHLGEPYLACDLDPQSAQQACRDLTQSLLTSLGPRECLFFEGLPKSGPMHDSFAHSPTAPAQLVQLELGAGFEHQFIRLPPTYAEYLAQLGSRSRQSVLYSQRRLAREMEGSVRCECFETEAVVERFVTDAAAISRKTYQWNLLGLGLRDPAGLAEQLRFQARHGWLRSFILYCKDVPVAFMLGSQHGDCYYYDDVGYDPEFAKWSVGSVLQVHVLEQLFARPDRPGHFDFSTGYGEHKGRFGNGSRAELNLLVMPATLANRALVGSYRLNDRVSRLATGMLARAGVKDKLKRMIRRYSGRKSEPG